MEDYAHMHADLGRPDHIISKLDRIAKFSDISSSQESTFITDVLLASVDEYFMHHAKDDVKRCWPNLRAMMQMTSATTDDEENIHAYSDVFGLTHRLCFQKSRQMYACIANHMKKKNPDHNYDCPGLVSAVNSRSTRRTTENERDVPVIPDLCDFASRTKFVLFFQLLLFQQSNLTLLSLPSISYMYL